MTRRGVPWGWIGGAVLLAPVVLFLLLFRPVREEVEAGFQGEARANPYLAAQRLFTRMGVPAETVHGSVDLPPSGSTVILLGPEPLPTNHDVESLLAWVESGGRLVATPSRSASFDGLFNRFAVAVTAPDGEVGPLENPPSEELVEVPWAGEAEPLRVSVPRGRRLVDRETSGSSEAESPNGTFLRRLEHGRGEVVFLADDAFLRNESIGRHDHARLATALVRPQLVSQPSAIVVIRDAVPSLASLLVRHAWPVLLSGALLLLAWLRLASGRFGPSLPEPPRDRRRLLEHVEAAGAFLWRQGGSAALLESARRALLERIHLREPSWEKLPRSELVHRAADAAGLDPGVVEHALYGPAAGDAHGFVQSIQTLETVRRSL